MHPILASRGRLAAYLLAWIPICALLVFLVALPSGLPWPKVMALVVPLCLVYAFACLSAWHVCRSAPLGRTGIVKLMLTNFLAALMASSLWSGLGNAAAVWLGFGRSGVPPLFGAGVLLYLLAAAFHYVLIAVEESRQAEARRMEAEILAREAELKALKAQVNPHFLFNCLNSISALTTAEPARAREMCVLLAEFLRSTLGLGEKASIPLAEEMALSRSYLAVERVRFGARLQVEEEIASGCADFPVPPLLLQPLVENAVTHGVASLVEGGLVHLEARREPGRLRVAIENTYDPEAPARRRNGMGLKNVRQRLAARYGGEARLDVQVSGNRYRVEVEIPA